MNEKVEKVTGLSNSPLGAHSLCVRCNLHTISIDKITIVGNLDKDYKEEIADLIGLDDKFNVIDYATDKFVLRFAEQVYIEYDNLKAEAYKRRNIRIEFNPNKIDTLIRSVLKNEFINHMNDIAISRLDIAFDFTEDMSDYTILCDVPLKNTQIFSKSGRLETRYFGSRRSDRYIRLYDKKVERLENADEIIPFENFWRLEFELKHSYVDNFKNFSKGLHFIKPKIEMVDNIQERAMCYFLMNEPKTWGKLHRNTKKKYKDLLKSISDFDVIDLINEQFEKKIDEIEKEIEFYTTNENEHKKIIVV